MLNKGEETLSGCLIGEIPSADRERLIQKPFSTRLVFGPGLAYLHIETRGNFLAINRTKSSGKIGIMSMDWV
jgi:hypothetical protein